MLKAEIYISLKKTVADPQGLTIKHALEALNFAGVDEVRAGKYISITLDTADKKKAEKEIEQMCRKLLANPVIEDYRFEVKEA